MEETGQQKPRETKKNKLAVLTIILLLLIILFMGGYLYMSRNQGALTETASPTPTLIEEKMLPEEDTPTTTPTLTPTVTVTPTKAPTPTSSGPGGLQAQPTATPTSKPLPLSN